MKILFIQNFFSSHNAGGAELLCGDLMAFFRAQGHAVTLLTTKSDATLQGVNIIGRLHALPVVRNSQAMETLVYKIRWKLAESLNYRITRRIIAGQKPDVIYLHNLEWLTSAPLKAAKASGRRVVVHAHNHHYADMALGTAEVIAVSKDIGEEILKKPGMDPARVHVVYNGILKEAFLNVDLNGVRKPTALFAGSISPHKGVHLAIQAVIEARKAGLQVDLEIAGPSRNTEYLADCTSIIAKANAEAYIRFIGVLKREDIWQKMTETDLLIFPSICKEAFGLIAAEAMANGAIVVGTNRGAIPEVVGACGKVVEPDAEALAQAIRDVVTLPHEELVLLRTRAKQRAKELFLLEERFQEVEKIVCGRNGGCNECG